MCANLHVHEHKFMWTAVERIKRMRSSQLYSNSLKDQDEIKAWNFFQSLIAIHSCSVFVWWCGQQPFLVPPEGSNLLLLICLKCHRTNILEYFIKCIDHNNKLLDLNRFSKNTCLWKDLSCSGYSSWEIYIFYMMMRSVNPFYFQRKEVMICSCCYVLKCHRANILEYFKNASITITNCLTWIFSAKTPVCGKTLDVADELGHIYFFHWKF